MFTLDIMQAFRRASAKAGRMRHEFVTPEHLLLALCSNPSFAAAFTRTGCSLDDLNLDLLQVLDQMETVPEGKSYDLYTSEQFGQLGSFAQEAASNASSETVNLSHLLSGFLNLDDSDASSLLYKHLNGRVGEFMAAVLDAMEEENGEEEAEEALPFGEFLSPNDDIFIGRDDEIAKAVRILCRMDCNNILIVGDHGVGKTALVMELCRRSGSLPKRLSSKRFFLVNTASLMSGTEMRGALEKNITFLMDKVREAGDIILVVEGFHNLFAASGSGSASQDTAGVLAPYLSDNDIPFIATTTFQNLKRIQGKGSSADRFFTRLDLEQPSREDTVKIASALSAKYCSFHGVSMGGDVVEHIVDLSMKHLQGSLPGKAISLMDDCGAWVESHSKKRSKTIDKTLCDKVVAELSGKKIIGSSRDPLNGISERIKNHIFGQDKAVDAVCSSLLMAKAGLSNPQKPLGSFLFVGPTGVGKTQLARTLSSELGEQLVRFDMSEYAEKHTVSKFIGSPAGYVGYDDGGLLTDAVRKNPGCVLLLDEIEKAHQDIYNLLLQIMDYGTLTDSKGQKADFRGVVLIMTSNAGARFASHASIGFGRTPNPGGVMEGEAKKVFAPEFLNRLSATVVFNALDEDMASKVLDDKLSDLKQMLSSKNVTLTVSKNAKEKLLAEGFSPEYGAREMERVIDTRVKPLLVKEILFGDLKDGGKAKVDWSEENQYHIIVKQ